MSETRGDADGRQARIIRVRTCRACEHREESIEIYRPPAGRARLPDPRRRLALLCRERYLVERSAGETPT